MSTRANIDPLVGRHFVSSSGSVAHIKRLAHGVIQVNWACSYDEEIAAKDEAEFEEWARGILGPVTVSSFSNRSNDDESERQALRAWMRDQ